MQHGLTFGWYRRVDAVLVVQVDVVRLQVMKRLPYLLGDVVRVASRVAGVRRRLHESARTSRR